jgi:glycogen debranching enzyme
MDLMPDANGAFEGSLEYYDAVPGREVLSGTFDEARAKVQKEFDRWAGMLPTLQPPYERARKTAAWVLWSSTVAPRGLYRTPIVWCSKSWMNRIWSWDHCFVAVGLAPAFPELAWQQLMIFQQMQDPSSGMLADSMNNIQRSWICTKPPVHGWALQHLMRSMPVSREQLREVYEPLRNWTNFWLKHRNLDGDGLPCILNPNESFDNTTSNTLFGPVKPPEIAAYLAIQLEVLGKVAQQLGHEQDARAWQSRSKTMVDTLVRVLWNEQAGKFQARRVPDGKTAEGDCIYSDVPIVLGRRLPEAIVQGITKALKEPGRFLTPYGLASEALNSPRYEPRSYVKGPVWAPPCTFIAEGLDNVGEKALASQIRRSFMNVCLQHGMDEHFDAKTGTPAGDPGYNWTAAMFLHFAREERLLA